MLKEKVIVVTGGSGFLGIKIVESIKTNKGIAILADINSESAQKQADELEVISCKLDITDKDSILKLINFLSKKFGRIDAVINNAYPRNKNWGRLFEEVEYSDFCENVSLHMGGYFLVSQQFAEYFKQQGYGNIINISSIYGVIAPRFELYNSTKMTTPVEYAAIKSGIIHLTRYIAKYYKGNNIRCNAVSPGGLLDNQPEKFVNEYNKHCLSKGMLKPDDITGAIIYLLSDHSKYVNGQNIIVDDGFTL